jgi:NAD(P)-dependent dehydrogenase (short-subunit alcohol dehydrogenase family)
VRAPLERLGQPEDIAGVVSFLTDPDVVVITGASSGFGALTARALARAGHTVYASIRDIKGRNAVQVEDLAWYATGHGMTPPSDRPISLCRSLCA